MANIQPAQPDLVEMVRRLLDQHGPREAAELLGVSRSTVTAIAAGAKVMPGTLALLELARQRLAA